MTESCVVTEHSIDTQVWLDIADEALKAGEAPWSEPLVNVHSNADNYHFQACVASNHKPTELCTVKRACAYSKYATRAKRFPRADDLRMATHAGARNHTQETQQTQKITTQEIEDYLLSREQPIRLTEEEDEFRDLPTSGNSVHHEARIPVSSQASNARFHHRDENVDTTYTSAHDQEPDGADLGSEDELASDATQLDSQLSSSQSQGSQKTPQLAGSKRNYAGQVLSSTGKTPRVDVTAMFGQAAPAAAANLSQLFNQTQQNTSPVRPGDLKFDAVAVRPSPGIDARAASPPRIFGSSPIAKPQLSSSNQFARPFESSSSVMKVEKQKKRKRKSIQITDDDSELDDNEVYQRSARQRKLSSKLADATKIFPETGTQSSPEDVFHRGKRITTMTRSITNPHYHGDVIPQTPDVKFPTTKSNIGSSSAYGGNEYPSSSAPVTRTTDKAKLIKKSVREAKKLYQRTSSTSDQWPRKKSRTDNGATATKEAQNQLTQISHIGDTQISEISRYETRSPSLSPVLTSRLNKHPLVNDARKALEDQQVQSGEMSTSSIPYPPQRVEDSDLNYIQSQHSDRINIVYASQSGDDDRQSSHAMVTPQAVNTKQLDQHDLRTLETTSVTKGNDAQFGPPISPVLSLINNASQEVPNSDLVGSTESQIQRNIPHSSHRSSSWDASNSANMRADDAQEHNLLGPISNSSPARPSTPATAQARKMSEIANQASPHKPDQQSLGDISIITQDDRDYHRTMAKLQPEIKKKHTKISRGSKVLKSISRNTNALPVPTSALKQQRSSSTKKSVDIFSVPPGDSQSQNTDTGQIFPVGAKHGATTDKNHHLQINDNNRKHQNTPETVETAQELQDEALQFARSGTRVEAFSKIEERRTLEQDFDDEAPPTVDHGATNSKRSDGTQLIVTHPYRVFARFRGVNLAWYPATCLGRASSSSNALQIVFDDGSTDVVEEHLVKRLELRVGDEVKIDRPGMKKGTYLVRDFPEQPRKRANEQLNGHAADNQGREMIQLISKSSQSAARRETSTSEPLTIPIAHLYMTTPLWNKFSDREFDLLASMKSRNNLPTMQPDAPPLERSLIEKIQTPVNSGVAESGMFAGMIFAVTYTDASSKEKIEVLKNISKHGGRLLEQGFEELFEHPWDEMATMDMPSTRPSAWESSSLCLKPLATNASFVALISDGHSRRTKYIQALALNVPCLSGHWILNAVKHGKLPPWEQYLLPAGESTSLGGTVRSRVLATPFCPGSSVAEFKFKDIVSNRPQLMMGQKVIFIAGQKKNESLQKAYMFVILAMGASHVERIKDIEQMKLKLDAAEQWEWVFTDDNVVKDARKRLLERKASKIEKQRKRQRVRPSESPEPANEKTHSFRIAGEELIVQSLILGAVADD